MAPADIRKEGSSYDLPLAMAAAGGHNILKMLPISKKALSREPFFVYIPEFSELLLKYR